MHLHYFGPMVVISKNKGGAYIICNLDGTLAHSPVTAFRIVPYFTQENIDLLDLEQHIDVSAARLCKLENTTTDPDYPKPLEEYNNMADTAKEAKVAKDSAGKKE